MTAGGYAFASENSGLLFSDGKKFNGFFPDSHIGPSAFGGRSANVLYEKTLQFKNISNIPSIATFLCWQNAVWYPGQTCEMELYEIRLD